MKKIVVLLSAILLFGCAATVPKEVVELSYQIEKDLSQIQVSYLELVKQHIQLLRKQRERYLQEEWIPAYIDRWILDGRLVEMAQGKVIFDEESSAFVAIAKPQPKARLHSVVLWADAAVAEIEDKRKSLLQPIEIAEKSLIADINSSFSLVIRGNQTVTAHLNSIREVQQVQNDLLKRAELDGLRDRLNLKLKQLSDKADTGLEKIRKLDKKAFKNGRR